MKHWKTVREFKKLLKGGDISPEQVCFTATSFDELEQTIAAVQLGGKCRIAVVIFPEEKVKDKELQQSVWNIEERIAALEGQVAAIVVSHTRSKKPKPKLVVTKEAQEESE